MAGSTRTFGTERQTDGADYIGPAVQHPAGRVQKLEKLIAGSTIIRHRERPVHRTKRGTKNCQKRRFCQFLHKPGGYVVVKDHLQYHNMQYPAYNVGKWSVRVIITGIHF